MNKNIKRYDLILCGDTCCAKMAETEGGDYVPFAYAYKYWNRAIELESLIGNCMFHRCREHYAIPQLNKTEASGAECGACIQKEGAYNKALLLEIVNVMGYDPAILTAPGECNALAHNIRDMIANSNRIIADLQVQLASAQDRYAEGKIKVAPLLNKPPPRKKGKR